jgi:hypothetical protein
MSRRNRHGRQPQPGAAVPTATTDAPGGVRPIAPVSVAFDDARPQADARHVAEALVSPIVAASAVAPVPAPADRPSLMTATAAPEAGMALAAVSAPISDDAAPTCTQAQLRRFIKSRPWIPMHELRRRFGIWGDDDDVSPVRAGASTIFVGLPPAEARMLGDLLAGGDVGYELSLDPVTPVVVGVYPMRPVPRG